MTYTDIYGQHRRPVFSAINDVELIDAAEDLPPATGGVRTLKDDTAYLLTDIVTVTEPIRVGMNSPIVGVWPSVSGIINTGGGDTIRSNGETVFIDKIFLYAPGGTLFNLTADATTEMYVNKVTATDPTNGALTDVASLGTIDGYRVPTFDSCNFERFAAGFTFTGTSRKIAFKFCPFREVSAAGVDIIRLDANCSTQIFKIDGSYIKNVQADTTVLHVETGGFPSNIIRYANTDHDNTVTDTAILDGEAGRDVVGVSVTNSFPLADSTVVGAVVFEGTYTATGSGAGPVQLTPPTTLAPNSERVVQSSGGVLEYVGLSNRTLIVRGSATVTDVNDTVSLRIAKNGTPLNQPATRVTLNNVAASETGSVTATVNLVTNDTVSVFGENVTGTTDFDLTSLVLAI